MADYSDHFLGQLGSVCFPNQETSQYDPAPHPQAKSLNFKRKHIDTGAIIKVIKRTLLMADVAMFFLLKFLTLCLGAKVSY